MALFSVSVTIASPIFLGLERYCIPVKISLSLSQNKEPLLMKKTQLNSGETFIRIVLSK